MNEVVLYDVRNYEQGPFVSFTVDPVLSKSGDLPTYGVSTMKFSMDGESILVMCGGVIHVIDAFNGTKKLKLNVPGAESSLVPLELTWTPGWTVYFVCWWWGSEDSCVVCGNRSRVGAMQK